MHDVQRQLREPQKETGLNQDPGVLSSKWADYAVVKVQNPSSRGGQQRKHDVRPILFLLKTLRARQGNHNHHFLNSLVIPVPALHPFTLQKLVQ